MQKIFLKFIDFSMHKHYIYICVSLLKTICLGCFYHPCEREEHNWKITASLT